MGADYRIRRRKQSLARRAGRFRTRDAYWSGRDSGIGTPRGGSGAKVDAAAGTVFVDSGVSGMRAVAA
jgi:hypothetical protein